MVAAAAELDRASEALTRVTFTRSVPTRDTTLEITMRFYLFSEDLMLGTGLWRMSPHDVTMEGSGILKTRRR